MTLEKAEEKQKHAVEAKDRPCIFGKDIHSLCPVRKVLAEEQNPDISKYIKPTSKMLDEASKIVEMFTDAKNMEYNILSDFCVACPFLEIFISKATAKSPQ
jgi:hypothetical protein